MFDAYKRFFRFAGEQKGTWYKGMAFELLRSIFEALQFAALLIVLRALVEQNMTGATPWMAFGIMTVSVAGAALCWYLAHNSEGHADYCMCAEKRIHIGERMKYMPMGYFNAQSLGSLTAVATSTMEDLESMSFAVIARTVVGMIRTTIFSLAVLCFDWRIGLIFLLGMLLFLWVNSLLLKKSRELSPGRLAAQTRLVDAVLEYIQGMSVVRAFHGDKAANQTLNRTIEETEQQNFKLERKRIPYNVLEQIVLRVTAVVAILLSIWFFLQGSMTLFACLMVVVSAFLVYSELESAGEMFFMLPMIDASIDRVEEIDCAPRMDEGGSVQTPKHCDISFEHVDFSYGERKIIRDVSFTIPEGTTTAIVGPSGSGKTTLTSLMARFWDVDSGAVKLGGIDVKDYALDSLMRNFSMVFQRVYLFNDSIENNIKFGKPDATHEEVVAAAKAAVCPLTEPTSATIRCNRCATKSPSFSRTTSCFRAPSATTSCSANRTPATKKFKRRSKWPISTTLSANTKRVWTATSANADRRSPADSGSGWQLPARWSKMRRSSFWTKRPRPLTTARKRWCRRQLTT